jgi:hypothetical protein
MMLFTDPENSNPGENCCRAGTTLRWHVRREIEGFRADP